VHRLVTHGAPIERVTIGAGCQEDELEGIDLTAKAAQHSASRRAHVTTDDNAETQRRKKPRMGTGHGPDARAHVSPHPPPPPPQQQQHPGTRHGGRGRGGGLRRASGAGGGGGITASLFESEDWEADPLWAAMEEAVAGGVVGSMVEAGGLLRTTTRTQTATRLTFEVHSRAYAQTMFMGGSHVGGCRTVVI